MDMRKGLLMRRAMSLPEVMIAASVLILVCSMVYLLFANCIILNQFNRERTLAMSHAEYVIEEIRNENFAGLHDNIMTSSSWDWDTAAVTAEGLDALNSESIDVTSDNSVSDMLKVKVQVSWQDRRGTTQSVSLETLIVDW